MQNSAKHIFLFLLLLFPLHISASYCYWGITTFQVSAEEGKLYLTTTSKDWNGISYISVIKTMLADDIDLSGFEIVKETPDAFIFKTNNAYYLLRRNSYVGGNEKHVFKLYDKADVSEIAEGVFFRVKGLWRYVYYNSYEKKIIKKDIAGLPPSFELVRRFYDYDYKLLLRDKQNIYIIDLRDGALQKTFVSANGFDILAKNDKGGLIVKSGNSIYAYNRGSSSNENGKLVKIPNLTASQTKIVYDERADENYIYDDDTFYSIDYRFFEEDITGEFQFMGKNDGFSSFEFIKDSHRYFFDADGTLWGWARVSMKDGRP